MFISDGEGVDIRTFVEKKEKPFLLPYPEDPAVDAFTFFHSEMSGYILDFLYHIFKTAHGRRNRRLYKALSNSNSIDPEYMETLLTTSLAKKKGSPRNSSRDVPREMVVEEEPDEESKLSPRSNRTDGAGSGLDGLLDGFEDDLSIEDLDKEELRPKANLAVEINLLR